MAKTFLYLGVLLVILGLVLMVAGTQTITYPKEVFTVNGMTEEFGTTQNYFWNFMGFAILLFGLGSIVSHIELSRRDMGQR